MNSTKNLDERFIYNLPQTIHWAVIVILNGL